GQRVSGMGTSRVGDQQGQGSVRSRISGTGKLLRKNGEPRSESQFKVFPGLAFPEKYQADVKQVGGNGYRRVPFYFLPGLFHFFRPVDIIENDQGMLMQERKAPLEIIQ